MEVVRSVVVDCHVEDVLAFLVREGAEPERADDVLRVARREGGATVTYTLEAVWTSTRLTRSEPAPDGVRLLRALRAARRGAAATRRLRALRVALERRPA